MTNPAIRSDEYMKCAINEHGDAILRLALNQLRNTSDAQDVVQETFIRLLKSTTPFESDEHMRAWLLRVAINICYDHQKSAWTRHVDTLSESKVSDKGNELTTVSAEDTALRNLYDHPVWNALANLPENLRLVMHLTYIEQRDTAEIARLLGIKSVTVRTRLFRARKRLRVILSEQNLSHHSTESPAYSPTYLSEVSPHNPPVRQ